MKNNKRIFIDERGVACARNVTPNGLSAAPGWEEDGHRAPDGAWDTRGGRGLIRIATKNELARLRRRAARYEMTVLEFVGF